MTLRMRVFRRRLAVPGALGAAALFATILCTGGATRVSLAATSAAAKPSPCGSISLSGPLTEPPDVVVSELPLNANGEHELILGVHRDRQRFCYRYTLNGQINTVAPTIRVRRGEHFALRLANDITSPSPGETLPSTQIAACTPMAMPVTPTSQVHHYVGYLNHVIDDRFMAVPSVDTNLHLHGFQGPADQENIFLSTLSTPQHVCEYRLTIPRTQPPGTYFYHPHVHGATFDEVIRGLSGAWIVEPDAPAIPRTSEHVLVLRYRVPFKVDNPFAPDPTPIYDAGMYHEAALTTASPVAYDPFNPPPWPLTSPMHAKAITLDPTGCNGIAAESFITINGRETPAALDLPGGQAQLLRIVNATSDSPKALELRDGSGERLPLRVVELDGGPVSGSDREPLARYVSVDRFMLAPSSRVALLVSAQAGETLTLSTAHYCGGGNGFFQRPRELLTIHGTAGAPATEPVTSAAEPLSAASGEAERLEAYVHDHPQAVRRRAITFTEYTFPKSGKIPVHSGYYITDTTNPNFREHSYWPEYAAGGLVPSNPDIVVKAGTIERWYLFNTTIENHIFHIHQMSFVEDHGPLGVPAAVDTLFLPIGKLLPNPLEPNYPLVKPTVATVLLDFRHVPRGTFVFHCHMLFHEDAGMMGIIRVE